MSLTVTQCTNSPSKNKSPNVCKNHIKTPIYLPNRTENKIEQGMARSSTTFKPGVSGNPGGRPKVLSEVRDLAREHTVAAMDTLVSIMCNEKSSAAAN